MPIEMNGELWITAQEAADRKAAQVGRPVALQTVYSAARRGAFASVPHPGFKRVVLFRVADIDTWDLAEHGGNRKRKTEGETEK